MVGDRKLSYDAKVRIRRDHACAVLAQLATTFKNAGDKNNHVLERMHLEVSMMGCHHLAQMIRDGKVKEEEYEFLTWLDKPDPPPEAEAKVPGERKRKEGASEYRRERMEYRDEQVDPAFD